MARPPLTGVSDNLFRKQLNAALDYIEALIAGVGIADGDYGDITVSGSGATWNIDAGAVGATELAANAVETAKINDGAVTFAKLAGAAVITSGETVASNDNDTSLPTTAAVIDYVGANVGWTYATAQATTSGTAFDFGSIPATASEIEVFFRGVSLSGSDHLRVQAIVAGSPVTSGYVAYSGGTGSGLTAVGTDATDGFAVALGNSARASSGMMRISKYDSGNNWNSFHSCRASSSGAVAGGGEIALAGALEGIRITRSGTNTFAAGAVNIRYR